MVEEATRADEAGVPFKFECRRSYLHRYIPADGVWVGLNGFGKIILNFYNDSPPLPKTVIVEATADGKGFTSKPAEIIPETDAGAVRQYEVSVNLSLSAIKLLVGTLQEFLVLAENQAKVLAENQAKQSK
jgi:hypothetical protein